MSFTQESLSPGLVSIVMPTYNQSSYLAESIQSVLRQTYQHWELIIVDNCSTDSTQEVVLSFQDARIKCYQFDIRVIAAVRNYGLSKARGEFVAFLDSDDLWKVEKLQKAIDELRGGADFVCTNIQIFGAFSLDHILKGFKPNVVNRAPFSFILLNDNFVSTSTVVARKNVLLDGFNTDPTYKTAEDLDLWLKVFEDEKVRCRYSREPLTKYRLHGDNNSANLNLHMDASFAVLSFWFQKKKKSNREFIARKARIYFYLGRKLQQKYEGLKALPYFLHSLNADPASLKTWVALVLCFVPPRLVRSLDGWRLPTA